MNAEPLNSLDSIKNGDVSVTGEPINDSIPASASSLPVIELPYTKAPKRSILDEYATDGSYAFKIVYVYGKDQKPFIVKGGSLDVRKYLRELKYPYLAHEYTYRNFRKEGKSVELRILIENMPNGPLWGYFNMSKKSHKAKAKKFYSMNDILPKHQKWVLYCWGYKAPASPENGPQCKMIAMFRNPPRAFPRQLIPFLEQK